MSIKVDVSISFPCSLAEWNTLCRIRNLVGAATSPIVVEGSVQIAESLTDKEEQLLEAMSKQTHDSGSTPLMDLLEMKDESGRPRRGGGKQRDPNSVASLMVKCLEEKGGKATKNELAMYVNLARQDLSLAQITSGLGSCRAARGVQRDNDGNWFLPNPEV